GLGAILGEELVDVDRGGERRVALGARTAGDGDADGAEQTGADRELEPGADAGPRRDRAAVGRRGEVLVDLFLVVRALADEVEHGLAEQRVEVPHAIEDGDRDLVLAAGRGE